MTWVATAIVGGALIGGAASQSAAGTQADAANNATALQKSMFDTTFASGAPYREIGGAATMRLADLLGLQTPRTQDSFDQQAYLAANPDVAAFVNDPNNVHGIQSAWDHYNRFGRNEGRDFTYRDGMGAGGGSGDTGSLLRTFSPQDFKNNLDPGYQFQLQQGQQALQNSQAAQGGALGGAALKDLIGFNQGMAATGYQSAFDRWRTQQQTIYDRLGNLASLGQNASANAGNSAAAFGNSMSNSIIGAGNARAAGTIGAANAITGAVNSGLGYYQLNQLMGGRPNTMPVTADAGAV